MLLLRQPCLGRVALPPVGGGCLSENWFLGLLFSGGFPWRLSASLLRVRAEVTTIKPLSQNREIAVCSSLSSPGDTVSISVCASKNYILPGCSTTEQHTQRCTPRPGSSLPFVFLKLQATRSLCVCICSSWILAGGWTKVLSPQLRVCESVPCPKHETLLRSSFISCSWHQLMVAPPPSVYLPISALRISAPCFIPRDR